MKRKMTSSSSKDSQSTASVSGERSGSSDDSESISQSTDTIILTQLGSNGGIAAIRESLVSEITEVCHCSRCKRPIRDKFVYKVLECCYHESCLQCGDCQQPFSSTCFIRQGELYCREHFRRNFGPKCSRCHQILDENSIVRKANGHIYHVSCFQCIICKRELETGDQFYLIPMDGRLVCRMDYENAAKESEMDCGNKRPRTTISAKSLETLKQAYQASSKPARHVREQLASETGLDMRVVQVWFQNRRAKEKRLKKDVSRRWTTDTLASSSFNKTFDSDSGSNDDLGSLNGRSPIYSGGHPFSDTPTELEIHADNSSTGGYQMTGSYSMNGLDQQQQQQVSQGLLAMQQQLNQHMGQQQPQQQQFMPDQPLTNPYDLSSAAAAAVGTPLTPSQQQALSHMGMLHSQHFSQLPQQQPPMHHPYSFTPPHQQQQQQHQHHNHHSHHMSSSSAQHSPLSSLSSYVPHLQGLHQQMSSGHMSPTVTQPMSHPPLSMQPMSVGGSYHH